MSDLRRLPVARRRNRAPRVGDSRATVPQSRRRCCTGDGNAERPQQLECERRRGAKEIDEDRVLLKRHPPSAIATRRPKGRSRDVASLRADALVRDRSRSVGDCACVSSLSSDSSHRARRRDNDVLRTLGAKNIGQERREMPVVLHQRADQRSVGLERVADPLGEILHASCDSGVLCLSTSSERSPPTKCDGGDSLVGDG